MRTLALLAFVALAPGAGAQPNAAFGSAGFRLGLSAYNAGHFITAERVWRSLAERDDAPSQAALGFMLYKGIGVRQSNAEAARWFRRAAEQGQAEAQFFLGNMYAVGDGVPLNYVDAHMWCELALEAGLSEALQCREEVARRMSTAEIAESYRRVADWLDAPARR